MVGVSVPFLPRLKDQLRLPSYPWPYGSHSSLDLLSHPTGAVVCPYFASLGSDNSECWALRLSKEHRASLRDRHQLIRSSWATLEAATVLGSSQLFQPEVWSSNQTMSRVGIPTPYVLQRHAPRSHRFPKARSKQLREKEGRPGHPPSVPRKKTQYLR